MRLYAKAFPQAVIPGQFIMVQPADDGFPLLRRPFSVCGLDKNVIDILFHVKGIGTQRMAALGTGDTISVMGPLGRGFVLPEGCKKVYLVAGGIGIAPLLLLMKHLTALQLPADVFIGAETANTLLTPESFAIDDIPVHVATDDGSVGYQGYVTGLFNRFMENRPHVADPETACVCACGPVPMLNAVSKLSKKFNLTCYVSVESRMACGTGACLGCAVERIHTGGGNLYKRVCCDGPVFESGEIRLDKLTL